MGYPLDQYITAKEINVNDVEINEIAVTKEANRRIQKGYNKLRKRAVKMALIEHFGNIELNYNRRHKYKKKPQFKKAFQRIIKNEPGYNALSQALKGEGRYYEHIYRESKQWFIKQWVAEFVTEHNKNVSNFLKEEKKRIQKETMLTMIPERYCDMYPLARKIHRCFILHVGPTNSGKTFSAMEDLKLSGNGVYLAPLRLLAYENYEKIKTYDLACNMLTGEEEIYTPGANITCSTIEMLDVSKHYKVAVIDEAQMISNPDRGGAWTQAILGVCADKVHVCMAEQALDIVVKLIQECGDDYTVVKHARKTKLKPQKTKFRFPKDVKKGDALIVFSRKAVLKYATLLEEHGIKCSMIYGNLPYDVRHREAERFISGETNVIVSTDAIGMGLNLPIRRVVFLETIKFDGYGWRDLEPEEIQQIAGRAGRFGIYNTGYFTSTATDYINTAYMAVAPKLDHAMINIPANLIDACDKYSDLLKRWREIEPRSGYLQSDIDIKIYLTKKLEELCEDKYLIADFVSIPFDINIKPVKALWFDLFKAELAGRDYVVNVLAELLDEHTSNNLHYLEIQYKKLDVAYACCRKFNIREGIEPIMEEKMAISEKIHNLLIRASLVECVNTDDNSAIPQ